MPDQPAEPASVPIVEGTFRIAAVSRLSGIPVPTIRMWERRYQVVTPARSAANGRLYSRLDIDRLVLLRSAVDAGHAISTIASLSDEQIRSRLESSSSRASGGLPSECRVMVCGGIAEILTSAWMGRSELKIAATLAEMPVARPNRRLVDAVALDAVIVELPTLHAGSVRHLRQLRSWTQPRVMIVAFGFASRQTLAKLDHEGITALALPVDPAQLARICLMGLSIPTPPGTLAERRLMQPTTPRRYDAAGLATIARVTSKIGCECPNHLADLLVKLNAFEQYSLECESTNTADASVHALLHAVAGQCRELLELALGSVLGHAGIADPMATVGPAA